MTNRKQQIKSLYMSVLDMDSVEERESFLAKRCGSDHELRAAVMELLAHERQLDGFMEVGVNEPVATVELSVASRSQVIGPYKVREQLGEGGMGVVYVAEQTAPVRRQVALKVIKPGMDSREVVARFEAERQALAMMNHPNIAKVFDAGATPEGRPYFVMELVRGIPITEFCDEQRFSICEQLELFVAVCHAVQHAHQKGIIHRDLKPNNVLVELHDVKAVPKVIDFGVVKAISQKLTEQTVYTQISQMVGTPLYMSPEQAQLSGLDVDTRSDVYSLGVLLYELLTGTTPFDRETLKSVSYDELRRIIREDEPPRPSHRVSTLNANALSTISDRRRSDARRLKLNLASELDWIVMKAMEKDRTRRYESVSAFAEDVQRYINDEPVNACPPSTTYRLRKLMRRHRTGLVISTLMAMVFLLSGLTWWHSYSQRQQEVQREQNRLAQVQQNVEKSVQAVQTAIVAGDFQLASKNLVRAGGQLGEDSEQLTGLAATLGKLKAEVAARTDDQGRFDQLLAFSDDAMDKMTHSRDLGGEKVARKALELFHVLEDEEWLNKLNSAYLSEHQKEIAKEAIYDTLVCLADFHVRWPPWHKDPASIRQSQKLLDLAEAFHAPTRASFWVRSKGFSELKDTAREHEFLEKSEATPAVDPFDYYLSGHTSAWSGDLEAGMTAYREALKIQSDHYNSLFFLAHRLKKQGRFSESLGYWTACIALRPDDPSARNQRRNTYLALGNLKEAKHDYEREVELANSLDKRRKVHESFAGQLMNNNYLQEIDRLCTEWISENPVHAAYWHRRGWVRARLKRTDEALHDYNRAITLEAANPKFATYRGYLFASMGDLDKARTDWERAIQLNSSDVMGHYCLAAIQVAQEDEEAYRVTCAHLFNVVKSNQDFDDGQEKLFVAWMCALAPNAMESYSRARVAGLGAVRQEQQLTDPKMRFPLTALGALLYRMGHLGQARDKLQLAIDAADDSPRSQAYPWYFLAMLLHDKGENAQAKSALTRANEIAEEELKNIDNPSAWRRKFTLQFIRREAEVLFGIVESSVPNEVQFPEPVVVEPVD